MSVDNRTHLCLPRPLNVCSGSTAGELEDVCCTSSGVGANDAGGPFGLGIPGLGISTEEGNGIEAVVGGCWSCHRWTGTSVTLGEVAGSVGASSMDTVLMDSGGCALVNGGAGAAASATSTRSAISAIQPDIELEERGAIGCNSVEGVEDARCESTQALDHQTAIDLKIEHAL